MNAPADKAFLSREYNNRELVPDHPQYFARWGDASARARQAGYQDGYRDQAEAVVPAPPSVECGEHHTLLYRRHRTKVCQPVQGSGGKFGATFIGERCREHRYDDGVSTA